MSDVLNHPLLAARYFFPGGEAPADRVDVPLRGATLACAHHPAAEQKGTVVFFHGNGETVRSWQGLLDQAFNALGWGVFLAEYRGYGGSDGEPELGRMLHDVRPVIEAAGDPGRLVVMGRSVGSIFALEAVAQFPEMAGLIIESGIADVMERLLLRVTPQELGATLADFDDAERRLDHRAKMGGYTGPSLILHARGDDIVDVSHAERLEEWAGGDCRLRTFGLGDHNSIMWENNHDYWDEIRGFLAGLG